MVTARQVRAWAGLRRMWARACWALCGGWACWGAWAQAPASPPGCPPPFMPLDEQMAHVAAMPAGKAGFLFEAFKEGRPVWLYGTIHFATVDDVKPSLAVMTALRRSDVLAVELDVTQPQPQPSDGPPSAQAPVAPMFEPTAQQAQRLQAAYASECLVWPVTPQPMPQIPLLLAQAQRLGMAPGYGMDVRMAQFAHRNLKPVVALETLGEQLRALTPPGRADFDRLLDSALDGWASGKMRQELVDTHRVWRDGDWPGLLALAQRLRSEDPAWARALLDARNERMAARIDAMHAQGQKVFVAVGALHLAGPSSLPQLLEARGYRLRLVRMPRTP